MKFHTLVASFALSGAVLAATRSEEALEKFGSYHQGEPLVLLMAARQEVFRGTVEEAVRLERERELLAFIAGGAHPQAKAIAIEWLGCLGSDASVPGLLEALKDQALKDPATAALSRIAVLEPGDAIKARPPAPVATISAEVAVFTATLVDQPNSPAADDLIAAALRSPNELLAGAALRRIRCGAGSPALAQRLLGVLDELTPARQANLFLALATRVDAAVALRPVLAARIQSGAVPHRAAALAALGRVLLPEQLPMVLELAAKDATPELATAARDALARAMDPGIDAALMHQATRGPHASAAIDALAARHAVATVPGLWMLVTSKDSAVASASNKALGAILPPDRFPMVIERLTAAQGAPDAGACGQLLWNVLRRHPDPAAAAASLEEHAAKASGEMKDLLLRYATRLRPNDATPAAPALAPPKDDDRAKLIPNDHEEVAYLDCGTPAARAAGEIRIRRTAGQAYQFGNIPTPFSTVDYGKEITYEITGLEAGADFILGFSAWDADRNGRRQTLSVNGKEILSDFAPIAFHADQPTHTRIHLPLPRALTADGKATVTISCVAGTNAVVSELWLLRRKPDPPATKRVLIVTGDDFPGHRWRETGPEFAAILRADPQLEVTISESPHVLGSPLLSHYDAVFLHFKNYHNRLPTPETVWNNLEAYIHGGGGLVIAHFGCGAMQEWNGFVKVAGRVWDPKKRGHDPYGEFIVRIIQSGHPVTTDLKDFTTTDELYTCLTGETGIEVLAHATSKVDRKDYPMAFVLTPGKGRVFHCPLGHDLGALKAEGARNLYLRGTRWAAGQGR